MKIKRLAVLLCGRQVGELEETMGGRHVLTHAEAPRQYTHFPFHTPGFPAATACLRENHHPIQRRLRQTQIRLDKS